MADSSQVWLTAADKPVELTSPGFPAAFNATNLLCEWVVRPRFGTMVCHHFKLQF